MPDEKLKINEFVQFRLFNMPCCGQLLCWVNPKFPNFCPECGARVFSVIKQAVLKKTDLWLREP